MQGGKINALSLILSTMQRTTFQGPAKNTNLSSFLRFDKMVDNNADGNDVDDDDDSE